MDLAFIISLVMYGIAGIAFVFNIKATQAVVLEKIETLKKTIRDVNEQIKNKYSHVTDKINKHEERLDDQEKRISML
jgi:gas vesicle protein